jgi:hypothetical protein
MEKTIPSYRAALEMEIRSLKSYLEVLPQVDRIHFDNIMLYARMHSDVGKSGSDPKRL